MTDERPGDLAARARRGLPDHHDPLAGVGGAPPAHSALTLRLVLATFGVLFCAGAAVGAALGGAWLLLAVLIVLGVFALVDLVVLARRKGRGEPG